MKLTPKTSLLLFVFLLAVSGGPLWASTLQELIDRTPSGEVVPLQPGIYYGPVVIKKPVILDGKGKVTIDGRGKGTVIVIEADGVTLKNLVITNSGGSHDRLDAGILIRSSRNRILNNRIHDTLFGIDLQEAHENLIEGNDISSKDSPLGLRGDGIRVWASHRNIFRKNKIHDSRDMVIWYSNDNIIEENQGWNCRYSLHFMYSGGNTVRRNTYHHNTVGIFLMYSRDIVVEQNVVKFSVGATGVGIGLKEADNMHILNNQVVYCASGFYFDLSPFQPDRYNFIKANIIAFNGVGVLFNSSLPRNIFKGNAFIDNLRTIKVHGGGVASKSFWEGNYYSDYQGFDRDGDGYGDSVYNCDLYLDTLIEQSEWMRMFYYSPVMSVLNLIARLVPISKPRRLMSDLKPVFSPRASILFSEANLRYIPAPIELDEEDEEVPARFAEADEAEEDEPEDEMLQYEKRMNFNRYFLRQ